MKISLTEIIKTGNIYPFKWGDSEIDFLRIFPEWKRLFKESKDFGCPFISIDSVEFYFDQDCYQGLSEIVIKNWNFEDDYKSDYFDIGWLKSELDYKTTREIIDNKKWSYGLTKGPRHKTPIILTNKWTFFGFHPLTGDNLDENKTELQKIYLRKEGYNNVDLNDGKEEITLYNT
ncbi:hypothetical protein [Aquimarina agarilytica]|uniref:hypothetical protein n=1 Tax=Aquimarina agarilytica TaxID=1087449 RepID=UPI000287C7E2|nr:hypothetical protein [Aquimarina agarilytica]